MIPTFPDCLKATKRLAGLTLVFGALLSLLSHQPLWHTDLWSHLQYGEMIWRQEKIPETEPIMPLAAGQPITDTAWLSQLIMHGVYARAGVAGLQFLYALSVTACFVLLFSACYRRTGSVIAGLGSLAIMGWLNWQPLRVIRPQLSGLVCFMILFALITQRRWRRRNWLFVPVLFVLWANLHGSFIVGLGLVACFCLGRMIDIWRRTRRITAIFHDRRARRLFLLTGLAATAALLNPYSIDLYTYVLTFSRNPNLQDLTEWGPLTIPTFQGQAATAAAIALVIVYCLSPCRISATEILLLLVWGGAALGTSRLILWGAPVAAYYLVRHGRAAWNRFVPRRFVRRQRGPAATPRSGLWSAVSLGILGTAFATSPLGQSVLLGKTVNFPKSVSRQTPISAAQFLLKHPPQGQIFNICEWGDYLSWVARQNGQNWKIFVASHVHLVPRKIWADYMAIITLQAGWESRLDRHGISTIVIDQRHRGALAEMLRRDDRWRLQYEDDRAVIFVREKQ